MTAVLYPDPDGSGPLLSPVERYDYDVFGHVIATELVNSYLENSQLLVTSLIDGSTYDAAQRLTGQYAQDPDLTWYLKRDAAGNITRTSDKATALASLTVTPTALTAWAAGNSRITSSNTVGTVLTPANDPTTRGLVDTYTYDLNGNVTEVSEFDGGLANPDYRRSKIAYDHLDRPVRMVTPNPGASVASVPGEVRNSDPSAGEVGGYISTVIYDNAGNTYRMVDVLGHSYDTRYDLLHRPTSVRGPSAGGTSQLETTMSYARHPIGWQVTVTDPAGRATLVEHDFAGRAFRTRLPAATAGGEQAVYATGYDADGQVSGTLDALRKAALVTYNTRGLVASVLEPYVDGSQPTTSFIYSVDGLLQSTTDPLGRVTSFSYDAGGRLQLQTAPDPDAGGPLLASTQSLVYDALGHVLASTDSLGQTSRVAYDARFRPVLATDPANYQTASSYDVFGNLLSVTDAKANTTSFTFDRWDRNYRETQGANARTTLLDGVGRVRQATDRNGRVSTFEYDHRYQLTREVWKNTPDQEIREFVYGYDTVGNLLSVADNTINPSTGARTTASDTLQFVYDNRDQLQLERSVNPLVGTSTVLDRDYDLNGLPTALAANLGGTIVGSSISGGIQDFVNQYVHDAVGRLTSVTQTSQAGGNSVAAKLATFQYDAASQLTDLRRYSATTASPTYLEVHSRFGYDGAGRVQSLTHAKSEIAAGQMWNGTSSLPSSLQAGNLLAGYFLAYDQDNRLTGWSSYADAFKTTYAYDTRDQVTGATHTAIAGLTLPRALPSAESYAFDGTGNRNLSGGSSSSANGTFNRVQNDGTYTYEFDAEGNQIRRTKISDGKVTEYEFDYRNRLMKVTEKNSAGGAATKIVTFQYDAFDRRTGKLLDCRRQRDDRSQDGLGLGRPAGGHAVGGCRRGGLGAWKLTNRYLYGEAVDLVLADEQLPSGGIGLTSISTTTGNVLWPLFDQLGSVRDAVDSNGVIRQHLVFDSFGNRLSETDYNTSGVVIPSTDPAAVDELFGYTGREWDSDVKLQYNRAVVRPGPRTLDLAGPDRFRRRRREPVSVCGERCHGSHGSKWTRLDNNWRDERKGPENGFWNVASAAAPEWSTQPQFPLERLASMVVKFAQCRLAELVSRSRHSN